MNRISPMEQWLDDNESHVSTALIAMVDYWKSQRHNALPGMAGAQVKSWQAILDSFNDVME